MLIVMLWGLPYFAFFLSFSFTLLLFWRGWIISGMYRIGLHCMGCILGALAVQWGFSVCNNVETFLYPDRTFVCETSLCVGLAGVFLPWLTYSLKSDWLIYLIIFIVIVTSKASDRYKALISCVAPPHNKRQ
jgi:hypothetical protein